MGVSAGLIPCPSALVVLLSAIALHRVGFGLALIVAFSLGLALSITGIGLVAILAKRVFARVSFEGRVFSLVYHVPGAAGWNWTSQLCDTLMRDIAPKAKFEALLGSSA